MTCYTSIYIPRWAYNWRHREYVIFLYPHPKMPAHQVARFFVCHVNITDSLYKFSSWRYKRILMSHTQSDKITNNPWLANYILDGTSLTQLNSLERHLRKLNSTYCLISASNMTFCCRAQQFESQCPKTLRCHVKHAHCPLYFVSNIVFLSNPPGVNVITLQVLRTSTTVLCFDSF